MDEYNTFDLKLYLLRKYLKRVSRLLLCFSLFAMGAIIIASFIQSYKNSRSSQKIAKAELAEAVGKLEHELGRIEKIGIEFAQRFNDGDFTSDNLIKELKTSVLLDSMIHGMVVAYKPFSFSKDKELYAPYFVKTPEEDDFFSDDDQNEPYELLFKETISNYTSEKNRWYHTTLEKGEATWIEPHFDEQQGIMLSVFAVPLCNTSGECIAVLAIEYSIDNLRLLMQSLKIGRTGYGTVTSSGKQIIYHPKHELVIAHASSESLPDFDGARTELLKLIDTNKSGIIVDRKKSCWVLNHPIKTTQWNMQMFFFKTELSSEGISLSHKLIWLSISLLLFVLSYSFIKWASKPYLFACIVTVAFIVSIGFLWTLTLLKHPERDISIGTTIYGVNNLNSFTGTYEDSSRIRKLGPPTFIPVGLYLNQVSLNDASSVSVSGYIWARFPNDDEELEKDLRFSLKTSLHKEKIEERVYGDSLYVKWWFYGTLGQQFNYSKYPFDTQEILIQLQHPCIGENFVLVPDITAYEKLNFRNKPGLSTDFALSGWELQGAHYSMVSTDYAATLGDKYYKGQEKSDLVYSVFIKRKFLGPFLSRFLIILVILFMLHMIVLMGTKNEEESIFFGWSTMEATAASIGLFFVVGSGHVALRNELDLSGIIYLEYFYFVTYLAILFVSTNAFLFTNKTVVNLFYYKDNLIAKVAFWPAILCFLYVVTLVYQY